MKYIANPVEADAWIITSIHDYNGKGSVELGLSDGQKVVVGPEMMSRMKPWIGDYYVKQVADGYVYLNPKDVFERKYSPKPPDAVAKVEG